MSKCACRGSFLERFLQPSVLMHLYKEELNGASIYKKLMEDSPMDYAELDPTGFYRTLKRMEEAGLLLSRTEEKQGRKLYRISPEGRLCLKNWGKTLGKYRDSVDRLTLAISKITDGEGERLP